MANKTFRILQRGLTLVECAAVLAITAIMVGAAAPSFGGLIERRRLEGAAAELAIDLRYIRTEAVSRNQPVHIGFRQGSGYTCTVIHTGPSGACSCDGGGQSVCGAGAVALKTLSYPASSGTAVRANVASMHFDPSNGTVTPAATVRVTGSDGRAIHHVVNIMGRVRSCSPGAAVRGFAAC